MNIVLSVIMVLLLQSMYIPYNVMYMYMSAAWEGMGGYKVGGGRG